MLNDGIDKLRVISDKNNLCEIGEGRVLNGQFDEGCE